MRGASPPAPAFRIPLFIFLLLGPPRPPTERLPTLLRTAYRLPAPTDTAGLRSRVSGLGLALGINLLLLLVLLGLGAARERPRPQPVTTVVELIPEAATPAEPAKGAAAPKPRPEPVERPRPVPPVKPVLVAPSKQPLDLLVLSKEDLAASDISKLPKAGSGSGAGDSEEAGRGPNGQVLYAAQWARKPTDAELGGYLPARMPDEGWGLIACRTVPGNRVEDCVELDQSPRGSHLASAVRQAAWQFRVRPPRKNGRPMIGEWVSIRIDYTQSRGGL